MKRNIFLAAIFVTLVLMIINLSIQSFLRMNNNSNYSFIQSKEIGGIKETDNQIKIVLVWNNWDVKLGFQPLIDGQCAVTSCLFTADHSMYNHSHAVIVYNEMDIQILPNYRHNHQRFIFAANGRRPNQTIDFNNRIRWNFFNWTMTYRRDSDILLRQDFGSFEKQRISSLNRFEDIHPHQSSFNIMKRPSVSSKIVKKIGKKDKLVVWSPSSSCSTEIRREDYVRMLSEFVPIDIYGRCGNMSCGLDCFGKSEFDMFRSNYKFYLAFEDVWCPDYVTTEFYKALDYDLVPVVLGGADYNNLAPPNSFINVLDFENVQQLADYLILLDGNRELYAKYFEWKRIYQINLMPMDGWCHLCQMLHDESLPIKSYPDIRHWWIDDGKCFNDSKEIFQ